MRNCTRFFKRGDGDRRRVERANRRMAAAYEAVPFGERVVFVPHCMRDTARCTAQEHGSYYICAECGACAIAAINKAAREMGMRGVYILKGGRTVEKLIAELRPRAVLGVACWFEGAQGIELAAHGGIGVQFVPLSRDGCSNTAVELEKVIGAMKRRSPA